MSGTLRDDVDFQTIFQKLGHQLEEIRIRALNNILSKLEYRLISLADLVHEKHLLIRLLEWFNFVTCPKQSEVLHLLAQLSEHSAAAEVLQDVGALDFLSHLRTDLPAVLQPKVDRILENLMKLPEVDRRKHEVECCVYNKQPQIDFQAHPVSMSTAAAVSFMKGTAESATQAEPPIICLNNYAHSQTGYFSLPSTNNLPVQHQQKEKLTALSPGFKMTTFPWLSLTPTDRHVISSTHTSLQSKESSLLVSACEFLSDVVFHDFPAEIFLQRPSIVKCLLQLLSLPKDETSLPMCAAKTLHDLTFCLHTRLKYHQDPTLYTHKQDFSPTPSMSSVSGTSSSGSFSVHSSDTRLSAVGRSDTRCRGDGRDGDSSSTSSSRLSLHSASIPLVPVDQDDRDSEDLQALQFVQLTLPQFCMNVMESALPLLQISDESAMTTLLQLLQGVLKLLCESITTGIWTDNSLAARQVSEKLTECLQQISDLMIFYHHSNSQSSDISQHRLAFIGLSTFLASFLKSLVPADQGNQVLGLESLVAALELVVFDECLAQTRQDLQATMLGFLHQTDQHRYSVYSQTARVCTSMQRTCFFLAKVKEEEMDPDEIVGLVEESLLSLPYHMHTTFIEDYVRFCSVFLSPASIQQSQDVLCKLLAHPVSLIKAQTYDICLKIVKECLSVNKAAEQPASTAYLGIKFLVHPNVLQEIVFFGMANDENKIAGMASGIMLYLLQSQLLVDDDTWQEVLSSLTNVLPVLQSYADTSTALGQCILEMLGPDSGTSHCQSLPLLEKFRGILRILFSTDIKVRSEGPKRLIWFIANEEKSVDKLPQCSELDLEGLCDLFVIEPQPVLGQEQGRSPFKVEDLKKVMEIITSTSLEADIKRAAVDQLSIMLYDPNLHSAFKDSGGLERILDHFERLVLKTNENFQEKPKFVCSCVTIVRNMLQHSRIMRHELAHRRDIYYWLVRVALMYHKEDATKKEISHTLSFLLFDEVSTLGNSCKTSGSDGSFSLPTILTVRYLLPLKPCCHYGTSPNALTELLSPDPLQAGPSMDMLRFSWNFAMHNGMNALLKSLKQKSVKLNTESQFSSDLKLSSKDLLIIQTTHLETGLQQAIDGISNAANHKAVSVALSHLLAYLVSAGAVQGVNTLHTLKWTDTLCRFFQIVPSSPPDELLLSEVLCFVSVVVRLSNQVPDHVLQWLGEMLYQPRGTLFSLLNRTTPVGKELSENILNIKRSLEKEVLSLITNYISHLPYVLHGKLKIHQLRGDLTQKLLLHLNVAEAPHFYNLAPLEATLQCLMHITARPGWSLECTEEESSNLCLQLLRCLLEVVSAFHIGRGGTVMSYMGKGVTKSGTLCLRHTAFEMATYSDSEVWPKNWLYENQPPGGVGEPGLNWMLTLWAYRDAEVRSAGLGIAVALTSTEIGRFVVTSGCKHIPGGVCGAAVNILLDHTECSMVRQQAALLLVNLTSREMESGSEKQGTNIWQGPVFTDGKYQVTLVGRTALIALLHHSQWYPEVAVLLENYYPHPAIYPVTAVDASLCSSSLGSESTVTTTVENPSVSPVDQIGGSRSLLSQASTTSLPFRERTSTPTGNSTRQRGTGVGQAGTVFQPATPSLTSHSSTVYSANTATQGGDLSLSLTPVHSDGSTRHQSIATPCLVAAVCSLLHNLLILTPQDAFVHIQMDGIITSLINYSSEQDAVDLSRQEVLFQDLVEMHMSIIQLFRTCVTMDTNIRMELLNNKAAINTVVQLLNVKSQVSAHSSSVCRQMYQAVFHLFTAFLQLQNYSAVEVLASSFVPHWGSMMECIRTVLGSSSGEEKDLYNSCLSFLAVLFTEEGKMEVRMMNRKENSDITVMQSLLEGGGFDENLTFGAVLGQALMAAYDSTALRATNQTTKKEKLMVINALKSLLAISASAKQVVLLGGMVEGVLEHIKHLHVKLNMESLQLGKHRKKDDPLMQEIIMTFNLLRNFIYQDQEVKEACYSSSLGQIIHSMWAWCQLEPALLSSVLALLTTYTARYPKACSSLAYSTSTVSASLPITKTQLSNNSLVHCLIKLISGKTSKENLPLLRMVFGLFTTLVTSGECRNILWKSNFLQDFSQLNPKKPKKSKQQVAMDLLWLELIVNLSFCIDGQQMILKIKESVELLLDFSESKSVIHQECATLILRNLCCHGPNKQKLLIHDKLIHIFLEKIGSKSEKLKAVAVSGLWALIYNNQKAKVLMKNANILPKLQEAAAAGTGKSYVEDIKLIIDCITD